MRRRVLPAFLACCLASSALVQAQGSDDCATPTPIAGIGVFAWSNLAASFGPQATDACSFGTERDVWFAWTAPATGNYELHDCGLAGWDTIVSVFVGAGCPTGPVLACNDDRCGVESRLEFFAFADHVYAFQLGSSLDSEYGTGSFQVAAITGPISGTMCFGDGSGTTCPCSNSAGPIQGCRNSLGTGATLGQIGVASIAHDTLYLTGTGMPNAACLYFQGTTLVANGSGAEFGDGLICVGGSIRRLGRKTNVSGSSGYPSFSDPRISVIGGCSAGDVRTYQIWYRNAALFCSTATFNLSNARQIIWQL